MLAVSDENSPEPLSSPSTTKNPLTHSFQRSKRSVKLADFPAQPAIIRIEREKKGPSKIDGPFSLIPDTLPASRQESIFCASNLEETNVFKDLATLHPPVGILPRSSSTRIRQSKGENRHHRRILVQLLRIDLVKGIRRRVVVVEIEPAVLVGSELRHSLKEANVLTRLRTRRNRRRANRSQHMPHRAKPLRERRLARGHDPNRMPCAKVRLNRADVILQVSSMLLRVGPGA